MNIVTAEFPLVARYLVPLKHKYLPQYPLLEHPQPTVFRQQDVP